MPELTARVPLLDWLSAARRYTALLSAVARAATSPRARSHRLGVRANPGAARARPERLRARRVLRALVGALRLQAFRPAAAPAALARRARPAGARRERRRRSTSATGLAVAFKVESHNHPSAVEPFQGAATGVGGILRDVIAMGARPIALLDGLRFGAPDWHFRRAVAGIGHYGNCVGRPERRRRDGLRRGLRGQPARERDVRRAAPDRARAQGEGDRHREPDRPLRRAHRPRRDRRRLGAREPGSRGLGREAAVASRSATRSAARR